MNNNKNNKINVMSSNNINAKLGRRTFMPGFIGRFLGKNDDAVAFLNIQSPIIGNSDPTGSSEFIDSSNNRPNIKRVTSSSAAMSVIHLLVIPKKYKYNAVTLTGADVSLVKSMRRLGLKVGKELVKQIAGQPDFISSTGAKNIVLKSKNNTTNDSDFLTGFHVWPSHSTGHLHMHVVYKPWKSAGYDGQIAGKLITTETLLKVLEGNGNKNFGVVDGSMNTDDFTGKRDKFRDLLVGNFNATMSNNNLKNAAKGLIIGNYKNNSKTVPFGAFKPSPLNNATRGQLKKIRQKIKKHANGNKTVYLKTLPFAAYTNKLRKSNNNK